MINAIITVVLVLLAGAAVITKKAINKKRNSEQYHLGEMTPKDIPGKVKNTTYGKRGKKQYFSRGIKAPYSSSRKV